MSSRHLLTFIPPLPPPPHPPPLPLPPPPQRPEEPQRVPRPPLGSTMLTNQIKVSCFRMSLELHLGVQLRSARQIIDEEVNLKRF